MVRRTTTITISLCLLFVVMFSDVHAQRTQVTLWIMPSGIDLTRRIGIELRLFEEANPDIEVIVEFVSWSEALTFFREADSNLRLPPDVIQVGSTWLSSLVADDLLASFTEAEQTGIGGQSSFVDELWIAGSIEDQFFSVPWIIDTRAIVYRKDIMEQVGIDPSTAFTDWAAFDQTLQTLQEADLFVYTADNTPLQVYPISIPGRPETNAVHDLAPWIWGSGGSFLNNDNSAVAFDQPEGIAGFEFYTDLFFKGYTPPNINQFTFRDSDSWFINRRAVMTISGAWIIQRLRLTALSDDIEVQLLPAGEAGRFSFLGGSGLAIWKDARNHEAAYTLLSFLTSTESQARFTQNAGLLPARLDVLQSDLFAQDPEYSVFAQAIEFGRVYPRIDNWAEVEVALSLAIEQMWEQAAFFPNDFSDPEVLRTLIAGQAQTVNAIVGQ